jgi:hypothetical protein
VNQCECAPLPACPERACAVKCQFGLKKDPSGCDLCECNPPPPCGPLVCNLSCPFGYAKGGNGCDICQCAPPPPPPTCKPVLCKLGCPNGYKKDASGCDICECNPAVMCKPVACDLFCKFGYVKDANGCETCRCNPMPVCATLVCPATATDPAAPGMPGIIAPPPPSACVYGRAKDAAGCDTCQCNPPPPCTKEECAAAPPAPGCAPPSTMTGSTCVRGADGKCAIVVTCTVPPGAACNQVRDRATCDKDARCRWLEPGCTDPKLPAAGCYDRKDLDCSPQKPCTSGRVCVNRVVNPCLPGPGGVVCNACGVGIMICL